MKYVTLYFASKYQSLLTVQSLFDIQRYKKKVQYVRKLENTCLLQDFDCYRKQVSVFIKLSW